jgi:hypothetical protein
MNKEYTLGRPRQFPGPLSGPSDRLIDCAAGVYSGSASSESHFCASA